MSTINKETFETIEDFAKYVLPDLIDPSEYSLYYGIFKNNIPKFRIVDGHRRRTLMVAEFYKKKIWKWCEMCTTKEAICARYQQK